MLKHIDKEKKKEIISFYKQRPITIAEIAERFNISAPSIIKILNEYHIKRYSKVKLFSPDLVEDYFENIDTEAKAYYLGLIITDGCVHATKGKQPLVSINLKNEDKYLLENFKKEINSNKQITNDGRGCAELNILSTKMVNDLKKYGVCFRKSLSTTFPKNISKEFYSHLIRGILDGDGSVAYYARPNKKAHTKAIRFCQGNEKFLLDIVSFLEEEVNIIPVHTFQEKENLWSIAYRKNESIIKLANYLYKDANIYMVRKKKICDLVCEEIDKYGNTEITSYLKK